MKRMLINATQEEELRMAMVDGQRLYDLNIELPASERKKANIYKGQITRIEPSLEAAFVSYGAERHGFLPLKEISSEYFVAEVPPGSKPNIRDVLKEGQDIVIQIDKEERGNKGAALTTFVSLAGRFIVLKPNKPRSGGVSRRIVGEDRDLARRSMRDVEVPGGMSVILRTAGIDRSAEELGWDLENLLAVWEAIKKVVVERPSPFLIYRESNAVVRALRDYLTNEIGEILVDDENAYEEAREFVEQVMPHNLRKLKHYVDPVPLFTRYQIESQIESAFAHSVTLPSGGSLVIDHTEALVSIDINSARATKGGDIEATALNTNLEAADEVARQLRLRDLGGLVVIDFIDMGPQRNQREVETRLREAVRQDRARVQIGKISRFGLLEMSRQRLRPSLGESSYLTCPRCSGIGNIRSVESLALAILRLIGEEARKERTAKVIAQLPVEVATYLLNEKRHWVQNLESRNDTQVIMIANPALETPHYQIRRVRDDQLELPENLGTSYLLTETETEPEIPQTMQDRKVAEPAAIATATPKTPAPPRKPPSKAGPGLWARLMAFFGSSDDKPRSKKRGGKKQHRRQSDSRRRNAQRGKRKKEQRASADNRSRGSEKKRKKKASPGEGKAARKPRTQRADAPAEQKSKSADAAQSVERDAKRADDSAGRGEARRSNANRRSRGGRRRRRSSENADAQAADQAAAPNDSAADTQTDKPAERQSKGRAENLGGDKPKARSARSADGREDQSGSQPPPDDKRQSDAKPAPASPVAMPVRDKDAIGEEDTARQLADNEDTQPAMPVLADPGKPAPSDAPEQTASKRHEAEPANRACTAENKDAADVGDAAPPASKQRAAEPAKRARPPAEKSEAAQPAKPARPPAKKTKAADGGKSRPAASEQRAAEPAKPAPAPAEKTEAADGGETRPTASEQQDAERREPAPATAKERDNGDDEAATVSDKPAGRLLPWDSVVAVESGSDKKDSESGGESRDAP